MVLRIDIFSEERFCVLSQLARIGKRDLRVGAKTDQRSRFRVRPIVVKAPYLDAAGFDQKVKTSTILQSVFFIFSLRGFDFCVGEWCGGPSHFSNTLCSYMEGI